MFVQVELCLYRWADGDFSGQIIFNWVRVQVTLKKGQQVYIGNFGVNLICNGGELEAAKTKTF